MTPSVPSISVIITVYNAERFLPTCLDSIYEFNKNEEARLKLGL